MEILIRNYFDVDMGSLPDKEFYQLYAEALWMEEREINRMAAAIAKAFGAE
jgi:hypothetical protein